MGSSSSSEAKGGRRRVFVGDEDRAELGMAQADIESSRRRFGARFGTEGGVGIRPCSVGTGERGRRPLQLSSSLFFFV
jgi:hypothetical protein